MSKKTTMKDIAKACGISVATVSYVLNNSEKEHISHDTRMKVLETAKALGYVPRHTARSAANRSNTVGIIVNWGAEPSIGKKILYHDFVADLQKQLLLVGFDAVLSVGTSFGEDLLTMSKRTVDAIFVVDADTDAVKRITGKYYVPIIFIDSEINDSLFCTVYPNYNVIIAEACRILGERNPYLVMENISNAQLRDIICSHFSPEDVFIYRSENSSLHDFLGRMGNRKGIVIGDILGAKVITVGMSDALWKGHEALKDIKDNIVVVTSLDSLALLPKRVKKISVSNTAKAKAAAAVLNRLLNLEYTGCEDNRLLLNPEREPAPPN